MAPGIHPPCQPQSSCQPMRCHPSPPQCQNPEQCIANSNKKGRKLCDSAVSIMSTKSKSGTSPACGSACGKFKNPETVSAWIKRKEHELRLKRKDRLTGSYSYLKWVRTHGTPKESVDCCAGHGHRGRLGRKKRKPKVPRRKKCTIL